MVLRIGDTYFNKDGVPGTVTARDPKKGTLTVEREGETFDKNRRYGFINGLEAEDRKVFQSVLDAMREKPEAVERVNFLHQTIEQIKEDPRKTVLSRYLEGELAHVMNTEGIYPRVYKVDESKT